MLNMEQEIDTCNTVLNDHAVYVKGTDVSFYVHYWGGLTKHFTNHVHKHSFFEVCYVWDGNGFYEEGQQRFELSSGSLFMSRPHINHQISSETGLFLLF